MVTTSRASLTEGPVWPQLAKLILPLFIGMSLLASVGVVDAFFVSELGTGALAAFGFAFPVVMLIQALLLGFGVGITSVAGRALGRHDVAAVRGVARHGLAASVGLSLVLVALAYCAEEYAFGALGAAPDVAQFAGSYFNPALVALVLLSLVVAATAALRALGETGTSAVTLLIGAVLNAVLDPMLIHGMGFIPAYGLAGAAMAMAVGNAAAALVALVMLGRRLERLVPASSTPGVRGSWSAELAAIFAVGLPAMVGQALGPLALAVLTTLVAMFGETAVAGYAVAGRLEFMVLMMPLAIGTALEPLVAQSWGAELRDRARLALKYARRTAALWGLVVWLLFAVLRWPIAHWFVDEERLGSVVVLALLIRPLGFVSSGMTTAAASALNAIGRAPVAAQVSALFSVVLLPLCGYAGAGIFGLAGVFGGATVASWITTGAAFLLARREGLVVQSRDREATPDTEGP